MSSPPHAAAAAAATTPQGHPRYTISGCTVGDSDALAVNNLSAFWADPNYGLDWPGRTFEYHLIQMAKRFPANLLTDRETKRHLKAVDPDTGRIVGYIRWLLPDGCGMATWPEAVTPAVSQDDEAFYSRLSSLADWEISSPVTVPAAATDEDIGSPAPAPTPGPDEDTRPLREIENEILSRKAFLRLDYLAVHPDHQRKGIASQLVDAGLKEAQKMGLDVYVLAFRPGVELYRRFGFRMERELLRDNADGSGKEYRAFMTYAVDT